MRSEKGVAEKLRNIKTTKDFWQAFIFNIT